ncbi:MAG: hypothetical protein ABL952_06190 [Pyrinomonadaceae bacterium]
MDQDLSVPGVVATGGMLFCPTICDVSWRRRRKRKAPCVSTGVWIDADVELFDRVDLPVGAADRVFVADVLGVEHRPAGDARPSPRPPS